CALKSCIAKKSRKHDFPDKKTVLDFYTHDLVKLSNQAGLEQKLDGENGQYLKRNWALVRGWSEESRYRVIEEFASKEIINAIIQRSHGVLPCIKQHW
ncbi:MAG: DNA-binding protein, partial [Silvibacterium sp.]